MKNGMARNYSKLFAAEKEILEWRDCSWGPQSFWKRSVFRSAPPLFVKVAAYLQLWSGVWNVVGTPKVDAILTFTETVNFRFLLT
jgi:hypothetical protein